MLKILEIDKFDESESINSVDVLYIYSLQE